MSSKYSPYGLPCFFTSSISFCRISASGTVCVDVTIKFPWRPVGIRPGWFRPCPFDWPKSLMGIRDIRKFFSTPSLITSTRCDGSPSLSKSYVPASFTPATSCVVGSSITLRNFGSTSCPIFFALSVAFQSVTQHFMKKNRSRAPAQDRRSIIRLRHGRLAQRAQVRGHFLDLARQFRFARQTARRGGLKCFYSQQVHAVLGARLRFHDQAGRSAGRHDRASLARNHPRIRALHLNHDRREVHLRIFPERARESLDLTFPGRAVERRSRLRFPDVRLRLLLREIRRLVFFFGANRRVRAHVQQ